jgi:hypothetical protein
MLVSRVFCSIVRDSSHCLVFTVKSPCLRDQTCLQKSLRHCRKLSLQSIHHPSLSRVVPTTSLIGGGSPIAHVARVCVVVNGTLRHECASKISTTSSMLILPYLSAHRSQPGRQLYSPLVIQQSRHAQLLNCMQRSHTAAITSVFSEAAAAAAGRGIREIGLRFQAAHPKREPTSLSGRFEKSQHGSTMQHSIRRSDEHVKRPWSQTATHITCQLLHRPKTIEGQGE